MSRMYGWIVVAVLMFGLPLTVRASYQDWLTQELVFDDFEADTYQGWKLEGNCWGTGPVGASFHEGVIQGWAGHRYLCTFQPNGLATGKATSPSFFIPRRYLSFLIGGGHHPVTCFMQLVVNGKVVRTATGNDKTILEARRWDVSDLIGQEAHLEIVDDDRTSNGYLMVDHIVFKDDDSPLSDKKMADDIKQWLTRLNQATTNEGATRQTRIWKMLLLFYPNTDTDYYTLGMEKRHFTGGLKRYQIEQALQSLRQLPAILSYLSNGYCKLDLDIKLIDRPVTFANNSNLVGKNENRVSHQVPNTPDIKPEVDLYNTPRRYDGEWVLYYAGPIPQDLAGFGGGGRDGMGGAVNYGSDAAWDPRRNVKQALKVFVHEMTHGFDGWFNSNGYEIEPLHHVGIPRYGDQGIADRDLFVAIHRGLLVHKGDVRYGYSPSVWLSGTPRAPVALLPCQLLSPLPESTLAPGNVELSWAPTPAPNGYEVHICRTDDPEHSILTMATRRHHLRLPANSLGQGSYTWYVQGCRGAERSVIGDRFPLTIVGPEALGPFTASQPLLSECQVAGTGELVRLRTSATSFSGVRDVEVEYTRPDGHAQRLPLKRRSLFEGDNVWIGAIWMPENRSGSPFVSSVKVIATDHAGREAISEANHLVVSEPARSTEPHLTPERMGPDLIGNSPLVTPLDIGATDSTGATLLVARAAEALGQNPDGKIWAEVTGSNGITDFVPLLGREWDEGDWRTKNRAPRQAIYRFRSSGQPDWSIVYAVRIKAGRVYRSAPQKLTYIPPAKVPSPDGPYRVRIEVSGDTIKTYVRGVLVDITKDGSLAHGRVGFREADGEEAAFAHLRVTSPGGTVLFEDDFAHGLSKWMHTQDVTIVKEGLLNRGNQRCFTVDGANWKDYRFEVDLAGSYQIAGLSFRVVDDNNFYMWQFTDFGTRLRPHKMVNGVWSVLKSIDLPDYF